MREVVVAATAPFGADVLERLAARHDVAALLTRPDRPAGRGRKVAAPPAKLAAERLGIPVLQPDRPTAELELPADTVVVVAYGLLIPEELLDRGLWLNVHPSLLPRWRGAAPVERALLAGDAETGVTIHETVKELDAGPIAAQRGFLLTPEDDAGAVYARAAELAVELLDEVLPEPGLPAAGGRGELRGQDRARRPRARPLAARREPEPDPRALAAHRRARRAARAPRHDLEGAARGRRARAARGAARGRQADGLRRLPPRPRDERRARPAGRLRRAPARRRGGRVRRPGAAQRLGRPRRPRPLARAAARLRLGPAAADARPRDRDARQAAGAQAGPAGAGGAPARRLPARLPGRRAALRRRERVGRARARGQARAGGPVHERRAPAPRRRDRATPRRAPRGPAQALLSRLGLGALAARPRRGGGPGPDARAERVASCRCQTCPGTVPGRVRNGHTERLRGRARRRESPGKRRDLAAEPRLAARRALRRLRCRASGCSTSAPRRAARRRCSPARSSRSR